MNEPENAQAPNTQQSGPLVPAAVGVDDESAAEKISEITRTGAADLGGGELALGEAPAVEATTSARPKYKRTMVFYGKQFGSSDRTVKRWVKVGKNAKPIPDFPPLDEPEKMAAWWARNFEERVPLKLLAFSAPPSPGAAAPPAAAAGPERVAMAAPASAPGAVGMLAALERLRTQEEKAGRAYADAMAEDPVDVGKVEMRQRAWERLFEALRKAEQSAGKILLESGELMPTAEVKKSVQEIFGPLFQTWRTFVRRLRPLLSGKTPGEQDLIWDKETDRQFLQFQENGFTDAGA